MALPHHIAVSLKGEKGALPMLPAAMIQKF
jgi:hypothetical protein